MSVAIHRPPGCNLYVVEKKSRKESPTSPIKRSVGSKAEIEELRARAAALIDSSVD